MSNVRSDLKIQVEALKHLFRSFLEGFKDKKKKIIVDPPTRRNPFAQHAQRRTSGGAMKNKLDRKNKEGRKGKGDKRWEKHADEE